MGGAWRSLLENTKDPSTKRREKLRYAIFSSRGNDRICSRDKMRLLLREEEGGDTACVGASIARET